MFKYDVQILTRIDPVTWQVKLKACHMTQIMLKLRYEAMKTTFKQAMKVDVLCQ